MATVTGVKPRSTFAIGRTRIINPQICNAVPYPVTGAPKGIIGITTLLGISTTVVNNVTAGKSFSWS